MVSAAHVFDNKAEKIVMKSSPDPGPVRQDGQHQEIDATGRPVAEGDAETVHLLVTPPPAGGGTCTGIVCGMVFQSRSTTWIMDRRQHQDNKYHGHFKSCQRP